MSIDPNEIVQAGSTLYEANAGNIPTTYIPTTSAGGVGFMVMSYPGRPPMVPGMPPMPPTMAMPYMPLGGPPPMMPVMQMPPHHMLAGPPMPPMGGPPMRQFRPHHHHMPHHGGGMRANSYNKRNQYEPTGPPVTVFVGNITERAPDAMIRHILAACGHVVSWKRVQAFGFCEYGCPESGLRAIRLLHDMEIGGKKLVVKVDAKTKTILDEFKAQRRRKIRGHSPLPDEVVEEDDYMDDGNKQVDKMALDRIIITMVDYESDMINYSASIPLKSERVRHSDYNTVSESKERKMSRTQEKLLMLSQGHEREAEANLILEDVDIEEGKRDLITREIGKFREIMKAARHGCGRELLQALRLPCLVCALGW